MTNLKTIGESLKGTDAAIKRVCDSHNLPVAAKTVYRDRWHDGAVLLDHFADLGLEHEQVESRLVDYLEEQEEGQIIYNFGERPVYEDSESAIPIVWVKPLAESNTFTSAYMHYGNEATLAYAYGEICLVATVPPAGERSNAGSAAPGAGAA